MEVNNYLLLNFASEPVFSEQPILGGHKRGSRGSRGSRGRPLNTRLTMALSKRSWILRINVTLDMLLTSKLLNATAISVVLCFCTQQ